VAKDSASPSGSKFIEDGMKLARKFDPDSDEKANVIALLRHLASPPAPYLEDPVKLVAAAYKFLKEAKDSLKSKVEELYPNDSKKRKYVTKGLKQRKHLLEVFCFSLIYNRKEMRKAVASASGLTLADIEKVAYEALDERCAKEKLTIRVGRDVDLRVIYPLTHVERTLDVGSEFKRAVGSGDDPQTPKVVIEEMQAGKAFREFRDQNDLVRAIGKSGESAVKKARENNLRPVFSIPSE